jgi:HAMP domain-containing protein
VLFAAGAAASAGGLALATGGRNPGKAARRLAVLGAVAELAASRAMEQRLGHLAEPYHEGRAGRLTKTASALTAAGAGLAALGGRRRRWWAGSVSPGPPSNASR